MQKEYFSVFRLPALEKDKEVWRFFFYYYYFLLLKTKKNKYKCSLFPLPTQQYPITSGLSFHSGLNVCQIYLEGALQGRDVGVCAMKLHVKR